MVLLYEGRYMHFSLYKKEYIYIYIIYIYIKRERERDEVRIKKRE